MDVEVYLEIWKALHSHLLASDIASAADDFVHVLIENGVSAEDLAEYALDPAVKSSLRDYAELEEDPEDEELDDELNFG